MKAAAISRTGPPDVIEWRDMPDPAPAPDEVCVKIGAVAVNPIDTYIRSGAVAMDLPQPYVIGADFAGTVESVGQEVTSLKPGQRVWGSNQGFFGRQGTFAERICVAECWCHPTPEGVPDEDASAGALVGITAHLGLFQHGALAAGEAVFVNGGTGGVGSAVVQLASASGAAVVTTAGTADKRDHARQLGADLALDYHSGSLEDDLRRYLAENDRAGFDLWFETQREPNLDRAIGLMRQRGRIILMAGREARPEFPLGAFYTNDLRIQGFAMFNATAAEQRACGEALNRQLASGGWRPQIGRRFALSEAAEAHALQEANTLGASGTLTGKIVLTP